VIARSGRNRTLARLDNGGRRILYARTCGARRRRDRVPFMQSSSFPRIGERTIVRAREARRAFVGPAPTWRIRRPIRPRSSRSSGSRPATNSAAAGGATTAFGAAGRSSRSSACHTPSSGAAAPQASRNGGRPASGQRFRALTISPSVPSARSAPARCGARPGSPPMGWRARGGRRSAARARRRAPRGCGAAWRASSPCSAAPPAPR